MRDSSRITRAKSRSHAAPTPIHGPRLSPLLEAARQPAALDDVAEAPVRHRLGLVAPEEPAQILLEGRELRGRVTAIGEALLERVHRRARVIERPLRP